MAERSFNCFRNFICSVAKGLKCFRPQNLVMFLLAQISVSEEPRRMSASSISGLEMYCVMPLSATSSLSTSTLEIRLLDKPHIQSFPFLIWFFKFEVKVADQLRNKFRHLEEADVLPDASSRAHSKLAGSQQAT